MSRSLTPTITEAEIRGLAALPLEELQQEARRVTEEWHGNVILIRGLIEYSNHCVSDCLYCGIRRSQEKAHRYRLTEEQILETITEGIRHRMKTFVLQGGEDPEYNSMRICRLLERIKLMAPDCAVTLSAGIFPDSVYDDFKSAGADRYLIRFETADPALHKFLRSGISIEKRLQALHAIRKAGLQLGSGFMTGLPGETEETLIQNILLARDLNLDMGGIGPFIPHPDTPLAGAPQQSLATALRATALLRLTLPWCHIPATTAAGTLEPDGREQMISSGANVLMPNISPVEVKKDYLLYPGKICLDESGFQCVGCLSLRVKTVGRELSWERGDAIRMTI
jgi:biotin synthase